MTFWYVLPWLMIAYVYKSVRTPAFSSGLLSWTESRSRFALLIGLYFVTLFQCLDTWFGIRKIIRTVRNLSDQVCWHGYLSRVRCMICMWSSWCHCHHIISGCIKSRLIWPFWCWLTQVVLGKRPLYRCQLLCIIFLSWFHRIYYAGIPYLFTVVSCFVMWPIAMCCFD